jgi:hypothetical protein
MKRLLKRTALLLALPISILANFSLPVSADSTAGIILSTKYQGGYNINIWQNNTDGGLLYGLTSPNGNLSLGRGISQATEGVRVYKFRKENYEYWVWDGTLDNPQSGTLEVYKNNRILMQQFCTKLNQESGCYAAQFLTWCKSLISALKPSLTCSLT